MEHQTHDQLSPVFLAVRGFGIIILALGLWGGIKVFVEAWSLYENPQKILSFSEAVEEGSNINGVTQEMREDMMEEIRGGRKVELKEQAKPSYFAAWGIVILLLLVSGRLAFWAITTGGRLVLYNGDSEKIAAAMVKETIKQLKTDFSIIIKIIYE